MNCPPAPQRLQMISGGRALPPRDSLPAYRPYTRTLLRRYFRTAIDIGRLPSILGGLCFRARVSSYRLHTFEDAVIFVHDMERVFNQIKRPAMEMIAGVVLLEYSIPEVALRIGITVQRAERHYAAALDSLSTALLEAGLLRPVFQRDEEQASPMRPFAERYPVNAGPTQHSYSSGSASASVRMPPARSRSSTTNEASSGYEETPAGAIRPRI